MSDIGLFWDDQHGCADGRLLENDLAADEGLETAVLLSLFTDRRAEDSDVLPDGQTSRRGWFGDAVPVTAGDLFGSRLWLLDRAKQTETNRVLAETYAREALQWLVEDKVAASVSVVASYPRKDVLLLAVTITRPGSDPASFRFTRNWDAMGAA